MYQDDQAPDLSQQHNAGNANPGKPPQVPTPNIEEQITTEKKSSYKSKVILILLVFLLLITAVVAGLYIYNNYFSEAKEEEVSQENRTEENKTEENKTKETDVEPFVEEVAEEKETPKYLPTDGWKTYLFDTKNTIDDINTATFIPDSEWLSFLLTNPARPVSITLLYPDTWEQEKGDPDLWEIGASRKSMMFSPPGIIILPKDTPCFDGRPPEWEGIMSSGSLISKEEVSFSNYSGTRLIEEITTTSGEQQFSHSYCLKNSGMAINLKFIDYSHSNPNPSMLYETIMSTISIEWD